MDGKANKEPPAKSNGLVPMSCKIFRLLSGWEEWFCTALIQVLKICNIDLQYDEKKNYLLSIRMASSKPLRVSGNMRLLTIC